MRDIEEDDWVDAFQLWIDLQGLCRRIRAVRLADLPDAPRLARLDFEARAIQRTLGELTARLG